MTGYVIRRIIQVIPVLIAITIIAFFVFYFTPGDPVELMIGEATHSTKLAQQLRVRLGLDQPIYVRYFRFLAGLLQGDLGVSYLSRQPVIDNLLPALWKTAQLAGASMILATLIGVPIGVIAAVNRGRFLDFFPMGLSILGVSAPPFWTGMLLIYLFALKLRWLPVGGATTTTSIILPMVTLGIIVSAFLARMTRSSMLEVLGQDYVRTARAKGVSETVVIVKHALRNAAIPIVTTIALQFGHLIGGSVVTESVFAWPGLGRVVVQAIFQRDAPMVQGGIIIMAVIFTLLNLAVDLVYGKLDPTIRFT